MASLRTLPNSPYWIACFTLPDGTRTQRSTKVPIIGIRSDDMRDLRKLFADALGAELTLPGSPDTTRTLDKREAEKVAQRIADQFEAAAMRAREDKFTESQARKVISDIYAMTNKTALSSSTIQDYLNGWLKRKELEAGEKTHKRYEVVIADFLKYLGPRASNDLTHVRSSDVTEYREALSQRVTAGTVNMSLKVLRCAFGQAERDGLIDANEVKRVSLIKLQRTSERRPFTLAELNRILAAANNEWRGMILFGIYTGMRLTDIARLTWAKIDLQTEELIVATAKTGRRIVLPLASPVMRYLETLPAGDDPEAPLFPSAFAARERSKYGGTLSNQFYNILVGAKLAEKRSHEKKADGQGRSAKRKVNELSFHSLRHTATSLLKNAGVSDVIARDIIGHDSEAVSRLYTKIDTATKRKALAALPDVTSL